MMVMRNRTLIATIITGGSARVSVLGATQHHHLHQHGNRVHTEMVSIVHRVLVKEANRRGEVIMTLLREPLTAPARAPIVKGIGTHNGVTSLIGGSVTATGKTPLRPGIFTFSRMRHSWTVLLLSSGRKRWFIFTLI